MELSIPPQKLERTIKRKNDRTKERTEDYIIQYQRSCNNYATTINAQYRMQQLKAH